MKVYICDAIVVVNNKFENKTFIYDRKNRIEYEINDDTFRIIKNIKENNYTKNDLYQMYDKEFINQLFQLNLLTLEKQKNINNVKTLTNFNNVRIFAELTDICNLKCKHCYGNFESTKRNILDIEVLKRVIDDASKNGVYQFDITGGEPLLYPYLEELLKKAYDSGMIVRIFTNLTLFNEKNKKLIIKYGVKDIVTSVDSSIKEVHEEFRGTLGCFDKTILAISELKKINVGVSVNTMIGNHNKNHIDDMIDFINGLKVKSILDVIMPDGRAKELGEDLKKSSEIIRDIYLKHESKIDENAITISCGIGNRFIYIKSDGNIYLCPSLINDKYKLGNIENYNTIKIWKKMQNNFKNLGCSRKNKNCKNCNGGCRARALKLNGNINEKDDIYCIINGVEF